MRIVMVGPFGLKRKGTMAARALPLARALVARGHQVTLLLPPWDSPEDAGQVWTDAGVTLVNIPLPVVPPPLSHGLITRRLVQEIQRLQPEIVHAFKPKAYAGLTATVLWWLRRLGRFGGHIVVDSDDWEGAGGWNEMAPYSLAQRHFFAWQERWGLTHGDALTLASRALQTLAWGLGVPPQRVYYVPNGIHQALIPSAPPAPAHTRRVLLYTRFVEFTIERLLAIWKRVVQAEPTAQLVVIGKGLQGEEQLLTQSAIQARIEASIFYLGWPGHAALPGIFAATDLAMVPFDDTLVNRTKCSAKLVELMAAGLPVVADAVGQNPEYIENGVSGIVVPPGDIEAFTMAILRLLRDADLRRQVGNAAQQRIARHFTWEQLVLTVEEAYRNTKR